MRIWYFVEKLADIIDTINRWTGRFASWIVVLLVAVVFVDVVIRYAFNTSFVFTQELEWHLFGVIFLIGAAYTLLHDQHVRVDVIYQRLSPKGRAWVNLFGCIFFLIPGAVLIIYTSYVFAMEAFTYKECSPDPGGIPCRFIIKSCIPVGFSLFLLQGISMLIRNVAVIFNLESEKNQET